MQMFLLVTPTVARRSEGTGSPPRAVIRSTHQEQEKDHRDRRSISRLVATIHLAGRCVHIRVLRHC